MWAFSGIPGAVGYYLLLFFHRIGACLHLQQLDQVCSDYKLSPPLTLCVILQYLHIRVLLKIYLINLLFKVLSLTIKTFYPRQGPEFASSDILKRKKYVPPA